MRSLAFGMFALAIGGLAGCYESPNVNLHKPGVYMGKKDQLVEKQGTKQQQDVLQARFNQVQTDR